MPISIGLEILILSTLVTNREGKMKKRYDYHHIENYRAILFGLSLSFVGLFLAIVILERSLVGKIIALIIALTGLIAPILAYVSIKRTYIEVREDGLLFNGWKKKIFSEWPDVKEIRKLTTILASNRYKVYTSRGNFTVGTVEPANEESLSIGSLLQAERTKYLDELLTEISKRAPHAKQSYSILNRPL